MNGWRKIGVKRLCPRPSGPWAGGRIAGLAALSGLLDAYYPALFRDRGGGFDFLVAECGFAEAARWALPKLIQDFVVHGTERIPAEEPLP